MNKGIAKASGEYLNFMNSGDCFYENTVVEKVLPHLCSADFYVGNIYVDTDGHRAKDSMPQAFTPNIILSRLVFSWIPHQASFIRKSAFKKYGYYCEDLKIISDLVFNYTSLVLNNAQISPLGIDVALYDGNGVSSNRVATSNEFSSWLSNLSVQKELYLFYRDNYEIMTAIKSNKIGYFLMRVYFFFYRHWVKH